jgi:putative DNA primase/helicase
MTSDRAIDSMIGANLRVIRGEAKPPHVGEKPPALLAQPYNDYGNAMRGVAMHGDSLRYCRDFNGWLRYDGRRWARDTVDGARKLFQDTMLEFARQALGAGNETASKFAGSSLNSQRITAAMREAQPHLPISAADLDRDPFLLNFQNWTVDLRTGERLPHRREHFITKLVRHNYVPGATCPQFHAFLRRVVPGLEQYVQCAVGYSLTGITSEKVVFVCHGGGNNGKTTFLSTVLRILEEYAVLLQVDTLMVRQESSNTQADLADLRGARFVMTSETEEGQRLAEGKLKRITQGMGKIKAVRKYENPIEFPETHKLWMDCNHRPVVRGTDNAVWNRLHLIPFEITIADQEIDRELPAKLVAEAEGILAWAVEGAARWNREGLGKPDKVNAAANAWRQDSDQIGRFVQECCITGEFAQAKARQLYSTYRKWSEDSGEHPVAEIVFSSAINERGFSKKHTKIGTVYSGIGIASEMPAE